MRHFIRSLASDNLPCSAELLLQQSGRLHSLLTCVCWLGRRWAKTERGSTGARAPSLPPGGAPREPAPAACTLHTILISIVSHFTFVLGVKLALQALQVSKSFLNQVNLPFFPLISTIIPMKWSTAVWWGFSLQEILFPYFVIRSKAGFPFLISKRGLVSLFSLYHLLEILLPFIICCESCFSLFPLLICRRSCFLV